MSATHSATNDAKKLLAVLYLPPVPRRALEHSHHCTSMMLGPASQQVKAAPLAHDLAQPCVRNASPAARPKGGAALEAYFLPARADPALP
mmetsp:Transcript_33549/g.70592  ORF Transcript_33549/g.70592 Transcript_33549/m.70592 type:complete len:90 (-) Transcript_33549:695-964(-)